MADMVLALAELTAQICFWVFAGCAALAWVTDAWGRREASEFCTGMGYIVGALFLLAYAISQVARWY